MPVSLPFPLTDGTPAKGSEVFADVKACADKFTEGAGGIADADISSSAAIKGTKLSTIAGNRVPEAALETDAVSDRVLRQHPSDSAQRAVGANHIKALTVNKSHFTTTGPNRITRAQTEILVQSRIFNVSKSNICGVQAGIVQSGANWLGRLIWVRLIAGVLTYDALGVDNDVTLSPAIAVASNTILGVWVESPIITGTTFSGFLNVAWIPNA